MLAFLLGVLATLPAFLGALVVALGLLVAASTGDFHRGFPGARAYPGGAVELLLLLGVTAASAGVSVLAFKTRERLARPDGDERAKGVVAAASVVVSLAAFALVGAAALGKARELTRKGGEGASRGNLGAVRSALSLYYGDSKGVYPSSLGALTRDGKYLRALPEALAPYHHRASAAVTAGRVADDAGGWLYDDDPEHEGFGTVMVNCTHTDTKGTVWAAY